MLLEVIADVCTACAPSSPSIVPTIAGDVGSPTTGPPPGNSDRSDAPSDDSPRPREDAPSDDKPSWWDRFFDSGKDDGSHDVTVDVIKTVGQDVATEVALDIAGKALPVAAGTVGALGTVASGSQTMAEGITIINENQGRGMGGSSKSGKAAWDAIAQEQNYGPRGRRGD